MLFFKPLSNRGDKSLENGVFRESVLFELNIVLDLLA
jgi:hypothetical protein